MASQFIYAALVAVVIYGAWNILDHGRRPKSYPPGPPTLPLLGNLHQIPMEGMHLKFLEWAQKYGPIVSLKLGAQTLVLLNKDYVVKELLDRRGHIYSARMDLFIRKYGEDLNILMRTNDEIWRRSRKMYHLRLNSTVADNYIPYQNFEVIVLLHDLLQSPESYIKPLKRFTTSLASTMVYGWRTVDVEQPLVKQLFQWIEGYSYFASRAQVADWFPILQPLFAYIPARISWFKKEITRLNRLEDETWMPLFGAAKNNYLSGSLTRSLCEDMLKNQQKDRLTEKEMAYNAGHAFGGAADTTLNTLQGFVKAMVMHPEAQLKAQQELDQVVGSERLPTWGDFDRLPYLRWTMKETLRWAPTTICGGMPHATTQEDKYMGYTIPAGAGVINNTWTINNDPSRAKDPRKFFPDRFKDDFTTVGESAVLSDPAKRDQYTFGAGRRICPGIHVAERSLFITMSHLLWMFDFDYAVDEGGNKIPIERDAMTVGFVVCPQPFLCKITPRDEKRLKLVESLYEKEQKFLDSEGNYIPFFFNRFA